MQEKIFLKKLHFANAAKFCACGNPASRKLVLWKSFENSERSISLTKLPPHIFRLIKSLLILF